jgi:hypothetical protein
MAHQFGSQPSIMTAVAPNPLPEHEGSRYKCFQQAILHYNRKGTSNEVETGQK